MKLEFFGNIYLIGFMGSGKSTVGPLLAKKIKRVFLDTDEWIENETGLKINEIFTKKGEKWFREKESECIAMVSKMTEMVVSVGGGAVLKPENWLKLKCSGIAIYLKCKPETIIKRIEEDKTRPLIAGNPAQKLDRIKKLLIEREPFYEMADIIIDTSDHDSPEILADRIISRLKE